jgi:hypothetical protein
MKINAEIEINDDHWNELSEGSRERYLERLRISLELAANCIGYDIATVLFNTKLYIVNNE